jgi:hypothetical protein
LSRPLTPWRKTAGAHLHTDPDSEAWYPECPDSRLAGDVPAQTLRKAYLLLCSAKVLPVPEVFAGAPLSRLSQAAGCTAASRTARTRQWLPAVRPRAARQPNPTHDRIRHWQTSRSPRADGRACTHLTPGPSGRSLGSVAPPTFSQPGGVHHSIGPSRVNYRTTGRPVCPGRRRVSAGPPPMRVKERPSEPNGRRRPDDPLRQIAVAPLGPTLPGGIRRTSSPRLSYPVHPRHAPIPSPTTGRCCLDPRTSTQVSHAPRL